MSSNIGMQEYKVDCKNCQVVAKVNAKLMQELKQPIHICGECFVREMIDCGVFQASNFPALDSNNKNQDNVEKKE
jgi:hypothetical protein